MRLGERLGQRGLAGARLALQEQRPPEAQREPGDRGEGVVGEVAGRAQRVGQVVRRSERRPRVHGASIPDDVPIRKESLQPVCRCRTQKLGCRAAIPAWHARFCVTTGGGRTVRRGRTTAASSSPRARPPTRPATTSGSRPSASTEKPGCSGCGRASRRERIACDEHPAGEGRTDRGRQDDGGTERVEGEPPDGEGTDEQGQPGAPPGQRGALLRRGGVGRGPRRPGIRPVSHR